MDIDAFNQYRPRLLGLAYRMLGSIMDAEDMVQEAFLRWQQAAPAEVGSSAAYLTTVVTRLCIDHLRSARVRREEYIGPWLPEPVVRGSQNQGDDADQAILAESLSLAFLVLLESLTPLERAVFLLHEVFAYSYEEIAPLVGKGAAYCRQIGTRARRHVEERRPRFTATPSEQERLTQQFARACSAGDMPALLTLLAEDVVLWADGGGKVQAARRPIHGAADVGRFLLGIRAKAPVTLAARLALVNGQTGLIIGAEDHLLGILALESRDGRIVGIRLVVNPDKLQRVPPSSPSSTLV